MGRPEIELLPAMREEAKALALTGATMLEIAQGVGVSIRTFYQLLGADEDFLNSVKQGRETFDDRVISSLGQKAVGYTYESEKVFSNGFRAVVHEHVQADTSAAIFWLLNRKGWRKGDNVIQDAIDATADTNPDAPLNTQRLALAAMALLGAAVHTPAPDHQTIDVTPNPTRPTDDEQDYENEPDDLDTEFDIDA